MDYDISKAAKKNGKPVIIKPVEQPDDYSKYPKTSYTTEEQQKLLIGYDPVPRDAWTLLQPKTHIRYVTKSGEFRRGGFIHNVKTAGKEMIFIENSLNHGPGYAKWPAAIEDISEIWKKRTVEDVKISEMGDSRVENLELEFSAFMVEHKKLLTLVRILSDRITQLQTGIKVTAKPHSGDVPRSQGNSDSKYNP